MYKMIHRKALLRCLIFGALSAVLMLTLGISLTKNNENDTSAAGGLTLHIGNYVYANDVHYYDSYGNLATLTDMTHLFSASGFDDGVVHGIFCVQPLSMMPTNYQLQYTTVTDNGEYYQSLKLLLFIYRYYDRFQFIEDARRAVMETSNTEVGYNYYWTHMLASWLMSTDGYTDVWPPDYTWQRVADYYGNKTTPGWFRRAHAKLQNYINRNDTIWKLAQKQTLYKTTNTGQTLMFIGSRKFNYGKINIKKCDATSPECTTVSEGASLAGIKFRLSNASETETIYDFENNKSYGPGAQIGDICTTGDNGECSFEGLPADGYLYNVEEIGTNSSYDLTAEDQTVTLNVNGEEQDLRFYDEPRRGGKIKVQKCDKDTRDCTRPQGNASFKGIEFTLYKVGEETSSGIKKSTNAAGYAEFADLDVNAQYKVVETRSGKGYDLPTDDDNEKIITLNPDNPIGSLDFYDKPLLGKITINKVDSETGTCESSIGSSFAGTTFRVINKSNNPIKYNDNLVAKNGVITTIVFSSNECSFTINDLPYGKYQIEETVAASHYKLAAPITVNIPTDDRIEIIEEIQNEPGDYELGTKAADADDEDNYINADEEAKIIDHISYCALVGKKYTIRGILMDKETGKPLMVDDGIIENSVKVTPEERCGRVDMEFVFDGSELGGHDVVVFETLYDEEEEPIISHTDIDDEDQTVEMIYIHTTATDASTEEKVFPVGEDVTIKDTVDYCLKPGLEYTLKGIIMDKSTGNGLLVNSAPVESEVTFTPEERCGSVEMLFNLNTTGLGGKTLVVFESLYRGEELINEHKDLDDVGQSIDVEVTPPDTGAFRKENSSMMSSETMIPVVILSVVALGGYFFTRRSSKSKVMKF